jgi:hypothetical protein
MGLGNWMRRLFGSGVSRDDEEAEREEYGSRDRGEADLERLDQGSLSFPAGQAAEVAEGDLQDFEAPRDPNP